MEIVVATGTKSKRNYYNDDNNNNYINFHTKCSRHINNLNISMSETVRLEVKFQVNSLSVT